MVSPTSGSEQRLHGATQHLHTPPSARAQRAAHLAHGQVALQRQLRRHNVVLNVPRAQLRGGQRHRALGEGGNGVWQWAGMGPAGWTAAGTHSAGTPHWQGPRQGQAAAMSSRRQDGEALSPHVPPHPPHLLSGQHAAGEVAGARQHRLHQHLAHRKLLGGSKDQPTGSGSCVMERASAAVRF